MTSDTTILVCTNTRANPNHPSCGKRGSHKVLSALKAAAETLDLAIKPSPCMGLCDIGPNVRLVPSGQCFHGVSPEDVDRLIEQSINN